jgi:hypothetical protein
LNRGFNMKIFPLSDPISLPLAPAITRTIADYLQSIAQKHYLNSLNQNCAGIVCELPQDLSWQWQCQRSIRQIPIPQYQYVSTIAHQLAAKSVLTPIEICKNLQIPLLAPVVEAESTPRCWRSAYLDLDCWYSSAGDIHFQLSPEAIAIWLNYIHDLPIEPIDRDDPSSFSDGRWGDGGKDGQLDPCPGLINSKYILVRDVSLALYAHARCCSLLRLADTAKLVAVSASWQISSADWLPDPLHRENRLTARLDRIFEHPVEQRLIQRFMTVLDGIYSHNSSLVSSGFEPIGKSTSEISRRSQKSPNWAKLTIDLAQSWLEFHRHCQVFGDLKFQNPHLAMARCGLTAISRRYLELLLVNYLGVDAPIGF